MPFVWALIFVVQGCGDDSTPRGATAPAVPAPAAAPHESREQAKNSIDEAERPGALTPVSVPDAFFKPDQRAVTSLFFWNGKFVTRGDATDYVRFHWFDLDDDRARPVKIPGCWKAEGLASQGPGRELALCRILKKRILLAKRGKRWVKRRLPADVATSTASFELIADADSIVLFHTDKIYQDRGSTWKTIRLRSPTPRINDTGPRHFLLIDHTLYLGYEGKQWGGALFTLDLRSGKFKRIPPPAGRRIANGVPVTEIKKDPGGNIWVAQGLNEPPTRIGALKWYDGERWRAFMSVQGNQSRPGERNAYRWDLPPAVSRSVAFGPDQALFMLADAVGVVRYQDEEWTQLTRDWPGDTTCASLIITEKAKAIIALARAGIVVWDMPSGEVKRITLPPPL